MPAPARRRGLGLLDHVIRDDLHPLVLVVNQIVNLLSQRRQLVEYLQLLLVRKEVHLGFRNFKAVIFKFVNPFVSLGCTLQHINRQLHGCAQLPCAIRVISTVIYWILCDDSYLRPHDAIWCVLHRDIEKTHLLFLELVWLHPKLVNPALLVCIF